MLVGSGICKGFGRGSVRRTIVTVQRHWDGVPSFQKQALEESEDTILCDETGCITYTVVA